MGGRRFIAPAMGALLVLAACSKPDADGVPVEVPVDGLEAQPLDATRPPGQGVGGSGLWVVDANGHSVGVLMRRGSDDKMAESALYDRVQVFDPDSGLFFDVTMQDAEVRFPAKVYFNFSSCTEPVGVAVGSCQACRSGYGLGLRHNGAWYRVVEGVTYSVIPNKASIDVGVEASCVPHSSSSTKGFPLESVAADRSPPEDFAAPLRFEWR